MTRWQCCLATCGPCTQVVRPANRAPLSLKSGVEAAIAGAAYTVITALGPPATPGALDPLLSSIANSSSPAVLAAYQTGVAAATQVLIARASDGFSVPRTPASLPNPPMSTVVTTNCAETNINFWQQLKFPTVKAFTPAQGGVFPPPTYASVTSRTQQFLAYRAAFARPFSAPTAADLVGTTLTGPNTLGGPSPQPESFVAEIEQVLSLSASLDDVNKTIVELWTDGPDSTFPPGHWYRIAIEESQLRNLPLDRTVVLLLALGNALQDAGIAAWYAKATWWSSRPITALQCLKQGQQVAWRGPYLGVGTRDGSTWQPY